jgi:hypothetical protein
MVSKEKEFGAVSLALALPELRKNSYKTNAIFRLRRVLPSGLPIRIFSDTLLPLCSTVNLFFRSACVRQRHRYVVWPTKPIVL